MPRCRCDLRFRRPLQCRVIFFTDRILSLTHSLFRKDIFSSETGLSHDPLSHKIFSSAGNRNAPQPAVPECFFRRKPECPADRCSESRSLSPEPRRFSCAVPTGCSFTEKITTKLSGGAFSVRSNAGLCKCHQLVSLFFICCFKVFDI